LEVPKRTRLMPRDASVNVRFPITLSLPSLCLTGSSLGKCYFRAGGGVEKKLVRKVGDFCVPLVMRSERCAL
jgi:hypothetical protein